MRTIEEKVSNAVLEQYAQIEIKGRKFNVAPPTFATLIKISELISMLPSIKLDKTDFITESLSVAKDCKIIGEIVATMIIGVNRPKERFYQKPLIDELSHFIINEVPIKDLKSITLDLISKLEIYDFFDITTSLIEVNLLRKTKEVV